MYGNYREAATCQMESVTSAVGSPFLVHRRSERLCFAGRIDSMAVIYFAFETGFKASCRLITLEKLCTLMYFKTNFILASFFTLWKTSEWYVELGGFYCLFCFEGTGAFATQNTLKLTMYLRITLVSDILSFTF